MLHSFPGAYCVAAVVRPVSDGRCSPPSEGLAGQNRHDEIVDVTAIAGGFGHLQADAVQFHHRPVTAGVSATNSELHAVVVRFSREDRRA